MTRAYSILGNNVIYLFVYLSKLFLFFNDPFNDFSRIREVHSDNEDGAGGGVTGAGGLGGDDDWANFDSFRKQEKVQVRAQPPPKPSIDNVFGNPP